MRAQEITQEDNDEVQEDIHDVNIDDWTHAINRLKKVAEICEAIGDRPLLTRAMNMKRVGGAAALVRKVSNSGNIDRMRRGNTMLYNQADILRALGTTHPVFVNAVTKSSFNVLGPLFIFIPGPGYEIYYNPEVQDLGADRYTNVQRDDSRERKQGVRVSAKDGSRIDDPGEEKPFQFDELISGYKKGWPPPGLDVELIVDNEIYYMLDLDVLIDQYLGDKTRKEISIEKPRSAGEQNLPPTKSPDKATLIRDKLKTYKGLAWWLQNPVMRRLVKVRDYYASMPSTRRAGTREPIK